MIEELKVFCKIIHPKPHKMAKPEKYILNLKNF